MFKCNLTATEDTIFYRHLDFNAGLKWGFGLAFLLVSMGSPAAPAPAGATWRSVHTAAWVLDRLIDRQDEAGRLRCRRQSVDAHDGRLPDAGSEVVCNVLVVDVHTVPHATLQRDDT